MGRSENVVKKDILRILEDLGIKAWPVQSGRVRVTWCSLINEGNCILLDDMVKVCGINEDYD